MSSKSYLKIAAIIMISSLSATAKAETWNMATPYGEGLFPTKNIHLFVEEIKEKTKGELVINVHSGASLYKSPEIFKAVRSKQVELGELLMANLGNDNALFRLDNIPFLATSFEDAQKLWEASQEEITKALDKKGVKLLYVVPWPPQNFYTKDELTDTHYFKGRKLRAYNATTSTMASLLDASPTTIQLPEIPQAFSTGTIDAMITSGATGVSTQAWDFVGYYTEVQAWLPKNIVFINNKVWRKLDEETQKIILEAAQNAEKRGWEMSRQTNENDKNTLKNNGMHISSSDEKMAQDLAKIGKTMTDAWLKEAGKEGQVVLERYQSKR